MGTVTDLYDDIQLQMEAEFGRWDVSQFTGKWIVNPGLLDKTQAFIIMPEVDDFSWSKGSDVGLLVKVLLSSAIDLDNPAASLMDEAFDLVFWVTRLKTKFEGQTGTIVPRGVFLVEIVDTTLNVATDSVGYEVQFVVPVMLSSNYRPPGESEYLDTTPLFEEMVPSVSMGALGVQVDT